MPPEDAIQVLSGHYVTYIIGVLSTTDVATVGAGDVSGAPTNRKAVLAACSIVRKIRAVRADQSGSRSTLLVHSVDSI